MKRLALAAALSLVAAAAMGSESIYNLIPMPVPEVIKPAMHRSAHPGDKPPTFSTFGLTGTSKPGYQNVQGGEYAAQTSHHAYKKSHATMGKQGNARRPDEILKKGSGSAAGAGDATMMMEASTGASLPARRRLATWARRVVSAGQSLPPAAARRSAAAAGCSR